VQSSASALRGSAQHCALVPVSAQRAVNSSVVATGPATRCQFSFSAIKCPHEKARKMLNVCVSLQKHCWSYLWLFFAFDRKLLLQCLCRSSSSKWDVRTVFAVQVGNAKDVDLAAHGCGESAADGTLAGDQLAHSGGACADGGGGGEAQESGEGSECELHCGCVIVVEKMNEEDVGAKVIV
jgi:hypothetical protein